MVDDISFGILVFGCVLFVIYVILAISKSMRHKKKEVEHSKSIGSKEGDMVDIPIFIKPIVKIIKLFKEVK